jgi:hypothetical protein
METLIIFFHPATNQMNVRIFNLFTLPPIR